MDCKTDKNAALPDDDPQAELRRTAARRTVVLTGLLTVLLGLNSGAPELLPRLCIWYRLTGTDCPFCGLTRSVVAAGDFRLERSFELHPFGPLVLMALAVWLIVSALRWRTGQPGAIPRRIQKILFFVIGAAWLVWWVAAKLF